MIINTWNIRHGGGTRVNELNKVFQNYCSDVLIITEFRNNKNKELIEEHLIKLGYKFFAYSDSLPKINTVMIACKKNAQVEYFNALNENKQRIIKVTYEDVLIYGCYFPQQKLKMPVFEFLIDELIKHKGKDLILMGDFNTGKHFIDENKASFYCSEYLSKLEDFGAVDAWRLINNDKREYTWYSNAGNGFRIDHCYISHSLKYRVKDCFYIHETREKKYSDHSLMSIELK